MVPRYHDLPESFLSSASEPGSVLLHSAKSDAVEHVSWLYVAPAEVLALEDSGGTAEFLVELERRRKRGRFLAGYLAYEAGYALVGLDGPSRRELSSAEVPFAWFGSYDGAWSFDHLTGVTTRIGSLARDLTGAEEVPRITPATAPTAAETPRPETPKPHAASPPRFGSFGLDEATYRERLTRIHAYLSAGDTYQVNFTDRFEAEYDGNLLGLYRDLVAGQPVPYAAFVNAGGVQVASLSPELFFRVDGRSIETRPMKGTAPRGRDNREDTALGRALWADEKSRAENVMIVDLLRNDLGRVCEHGSVDVPELFAVERYRTVQQMTSTVTGTLRPGIALPELFGALFPCGSVTGAPKRRTMEIIRELEREPRGVYTGAIGHVAPDGRMAFNVAIRTLVQKARLVLGAGGGIVADSEPSDEYRECLLKARFATHPEEPFELIETIGWEDGYRFLDDHLARLRSSAEYFGFALDEDALRVELAALGVPWSDGAVYRVGIRLPAGGAFRVTSELFRDRPRTGLRVAISDATIDSRDPHRRHKTTRRELYDLSSVRGRAEGLADVLFFNERLELAEGAISNVFLEIGGELLTPPVESGALPGIFRAQVLASDPRAREAVLVSADLERASAVWLCSALRGMRRVRVVRVADSVQVD